MKSTLLIVTPQASFGVSIRDGLDPSRFDVFFTSDFSEAIHSLRNNQGNSPIVLLDTELEDVELSVMDIGFGLRQIKPDIQFVLVMRAGQELDTELLSPVAMLSKPISLPDLGRLLEGLNLPASNHKPMNAPMTESKPAEQPIDASSHLVWLTDVSKAAQHLTQLTLESSAQAAFITRQNELWAYAGQLSREAAQELTDSIQRYWDTKGESDLLRFVRLKATEAQHMLYVRKLSENMTLALVFDAETPFSTIRTQAGKLVKNLFESPNSETGQTPAPANDRAAASPSYDQHDDFLSKSRGSPGSSTEQRDDYQEIPPISELLGDVPPPIPPKPAMKINLPWEQPTSNTSEQPTVVAEPDSSIGLANRADAPPRAGTGTTSQTELSSESPSQTKRDDTSSMQSKRDSRKRPMPAMDETFASPSSTSNVDLQVGVSGREIPDDLQMTRKQEAHIDPESVTETRAQAVGEFTPDGAHRILIEPPSLSQINLTYACLLIPRFEHHHLIGDAAARLNEWVPQLCVAFGWRLEYMSVRPDYLQWIARVPLNTAAGYVIRIIRQHTSERFFAEFPRFGIDNPSGEFWAPGFIVQGGSQTHPQKQVRDFIKQTRMRQGLR